MRNLSKSKIIAFRQCPKRLWLEIYKPELRDDSASEVAFKIGHQVGDIARTLYDPKGNGETIDTASLGHSKALRRSAELLSEGQKPVFEAGLSAQGALAYADVMLPIMSDGQLRWRMIEVKSTTGVKAYQLDDIAVQSHIAIASGVSLISVSLAHIDNSFVYQGTGDYHGLLQEVDLTNEALSRFDEVTEWITRAHEIAEQEKEPQVATGPQCTAPFTCGFRDYCNRNKVLPEFPLSALPNLHFRKREKFESAGYGDLREVPDLELNDIQRRVKECSVSGSAFFDTEGAAADLEAYGFPAYFLDFETVSFAVPIWKGTRPYQQIPFQFSLHQVDETGLVTHSHFLDLTGVDPSPAFSEALVNQCGVAGPVFVYNASFEATRIRELARRLPDLATRLEAVIQRIVDLHPIARNRYYHPSQRGSWSIKSVLPALCPELSYAQLNGVQDGEMAIEAYKKAVARETMPEKKMVIEQQLMEYCKLDTMALVRMWQIFRKFA